MKKLCSSFIVAVVWVVFGQTAFGAAPDLHSWSDKLGSSRYQVLSQFGGEAILDKETGLIFEQSPDTSTFNWHGAQDRCTRLSKGGRLGWRLPAIQELASLIDPAAGGAPFLPAGHPFSNVQPAFYWSATTSDSFANAWGVLFGAGDLIISEKDFIFDHVWCMRGGSGVDPQ